MQSPPSTADPAVTVTSADVSPGATNPVTSNVRVSHRQVSAPHGQPSDPLKASGGSLKVSVLPAPLNVAVSPDPPVCRPTQPFGAAGPHCPSTTTYVVCALKGGVLGTVIPVIVVSNVSKM